MVTIKIKYIFTTLITLFVFNTSTQLAIASDAYVRTKYQEGQGILRKAGSSCFLYTPAHVITGAKAALVETRLRKRIRAELINTYPQDLAIAKLEDASACEESSWKGGGERVDAILDVVRAGRLNYKHKQGRIEIFDIEITDKALDATFDIKLKNNKEFRKGMSGSIVTVGDYPIGMLLSVEGDIGKVLRMDTMADLSKRVILRYVTDKEKIEMGEVSAINNTQQSNTQASSSVTAHEKPQTQTNLKPDKIESKGTLSEGDVQEVKILARGNTAYNIVSQPQQKNVKYKLYFFDDAGNELFSSNVEQSKRKLEWGVGVADAGEYTLRVVGVSGSGEYNLAIHTVATPEELLSPSNVIGTNDSISGGLSRGTYAEYKILAQGNTAYNIVAKPQQKNVKYKLFFIDDAGNELFSSNVEQSKRKLEWGIGVTEAGEYTLRVVGVSGSGEYNLAVNTVATPEELLSPSNVIGTNASISGGLSHGTYAEYKILAQGNTAYNIVAKPQQKNVKYKLTLLDDAGNELFSSNVEQSKRKLEWGVGVTKAGEYTLRIVGVSKSGMFNFKVETVATPEELISKSNIISLNDSISGGLSRGTYAEYKIIFKSNAAYKITAKPQRNNVTYRLELYDSIGKRILRSGTTQSKRKFQWDLDSAQQGEYVLRIVGVNGTGNYFFKLEG
ncbi:hypothetical protein [Thalassotalea sp. PLHSN55]|uniref:hypothetical protein n=1 Tax=Thalassotalea sp. PLHSN55 TaxID=3435888 RepID=UPI003F825264